MVQTSKRAGAICTIQDSPSIPLCTFTSHFSNFGVRDLTEALGCAEVVTDQLIYSLLFRAIEYEILAKCRATEVGVLAYSPLAQGLLTGKFKGPDEVDDERARVRLFSKHRPGTVHDGEGCENEACEALDKIHAICADLGEPMANVALAWVLQQPGITGVLAGARKPDQIINNARAVDLELTNEALISLSDATQEVKKKQMLRRPSRWQSGLSGKLSAD